MIVIISVIIPVYNVENYLEFCLNSIINQSYHDLEIILIDDASTDSSGRICDKFASVDSRITVFHNSENRGVVYSRSKGFQYAHGEYISCVDADDWIDLDTYERVVNVINNFKPDMISYGYCKEYEGIVEEQNEYLQEGVYIKSELKKRIGMNRPFYTPFISGSLCTKIIKSKLIKMYEVQIPREMNVSEDATLTYICLNDTKFFYVLDKCFYHRRDRKGSASFIWKSENYHSCVLGVQILIEKAREHNILEGEFKQALVNYIIFQLLACAPDKIFSEGNFEKGLIFPKMKKKSKIIIYGKGHIGEKLYKIMKHSSQYQLISWIDRSDNYKLSAIDENMYDYVIIAVAYAEKVVDIKKKLYEFEIKNNKIITFSDMNCSLNILPNDIRSMFDDK